MGMIYGGQNYIFSKNLQGDVIGIYNPSRQLVAKYQYNARNLDRVGLSQIKEKYDILKIWVIKNSGNNT